ncbi:MAG: DUF488 domain-containing protein [Anaerolineae bacterium]|nr:DUF488 domain-containing protein [Anaerolineae bacterium]
MKITTIGVYGFDEAGFFQTLQQAGVQLFVDVRRRRGVRGRDYAFVNSIRLQNRLAELGIAYRYEPALAPTQAMREQQAAIDKSQKVAKRQRSTLSPTFITAYQQECLAPFDSQQFIRSLDPETQVICFFCVERDPEACHRSLIANYLGQDLAIQVEHLL